MSKEGVSKMKAKFMKWLKAALVRAVKTVAQTAVSLIGTNTIGITEVDWLAIGGASVLAGIVSILTSIAGIPEAKTEEIEEVG